MAETLSRTQPPMNNPMKLFKHVQGSQTLGLGAVAVVAAVGFTVASPFFLTEANLRNILISVSVIGTMAAVLTLVVVAGMLDLSVGSAAALSAVTAATVTTTWGWSPAWGALAAVAAGGACGALNAFIVTAIRINPIIVTIGTLSVFRGLAFIVTDGRDVAVNDPLSDFLAFEQVWFIPVPVLIMLIVFAATAWTAHQTTFGRALYAIGANPKAARLAGLPMARTRATMLIVMGLVVGVAALLLNAQSGSAVPGAAAGYELQALTAVLLGGASLQGGEGRISGTLLGVLIIGIINNGMTLMSVPSFYQTVASGLLLLVAVAIDQLRRGGGFR